MWMVRLAVAPAGVGDHRAAGARDCEFRTTGCGVCTAGRERAAHIAC